MKLGTNNLKALANKKVLMAFLNLFKDWVFLIEPRRSFHNLGAAAWKDRSPSVVSVLPLQGARSKPSLEQKSHLRKKGGKRYKDKENY